MSSRSLKRALIVAAGAVGAVATSLAAHDLFLKPRDFFVDPGAPLTIDVLNGTFSKSENSITRDRLLDVSMRGPGGSVAIDTSEWGVDGDTSQLVIRAGSEGTWTIGASTKPRMIELTGAEFNEYLRVDGIPDVLAERRAKGELDRPARERYHKHIKAIVQAGASRTGEYGEPFGYPAELIPLGNPYDLRVGDTLRVRAVANGRPVANQYVVSGGRTWNGGRIQMRGVRTDAQGVASIRIRARGAWYVKFIHMTRLEGDTEADYESRWASLTFGVR